MQRYLATNVAKDNEFQKMFNGFYRVRQRSREWYSHYYQMLEDLKVQNLNFGEILKELKSRTGRLEASFASKMYATKNPDYPIIDKWVLDNLDLRLPYTYENNRCKKIINLYGNIINWYDSFVSSKKGSESIKIFNEICPGSDISDVKKVDFILWQMR